MHRAVITALAIILLARTAFAQSFDVAAEANWSKVEVVHFEAVGEIADKHVQIPPSTPIPTSTWPIASSPTVK